MLPQVYYVDLSLSAAIGIRLLGGLSKIVQYQIVISPCGSIPHGLVLQASWRSTVRVGPGRPVAQRTYIIINHASRLRIAARDLVSFRFHLYRDILSDHYPLGVDDHCHAILKGSGSGFDKLRSGLAAAVTFSLLVGTRQPYHGAVLSLWNHVWHKESRQLINSGSRLSQILST